jgi:hypothetical protein
MQEEGNAKAQREEKKWIRERVRGGKRDGVREKGKGWKGKTILRHFVFLCPVLVCFFISFFPLSLSPLVFVFGFPCALATLRLCVPFFLPSLLSLCVRV